MSDDKQRITDIESAIDGTGDYRVDDMGDPYTRGYDAGWKNAMHSKYDEQEYMLRARVAELEQQIERANSTITRYRALAEPTTEPSDGN